MDHLAIPVRDVDRARSFYERHLGFGARPPRRYPDGVMMLYDAKGFALALGPSHDPAWPHFGVALPDRDAVLALRDRLAADGVELVEEWDEPEYASVKCRDPDGHVVEAFWEPPPSADGGLDGFAYSDVRIGPTRYRPGVAGDGPPVLLLHGFPQTHFCWHRVAPALTATATVVVCDLKGYGESRAAPGGPLGEGYGNRDRSGELVELMARLGFPRFTVVGHDRGGRVAYRMALDHPDAVERLGVLNIVPTADQFERMTAEASLDYYPWFLLAQPAPFAERLVAAGAEDFLRHTLDAWSATPGAITPEAFARYLRAFTPAAIAGMCADFRAAFHLDRPLDAEDRRRGRRIGCPVLVHWGAEEGSMSQGPLDVWRRWAGDVRGGPIASGHFIPEEAPDALLRSLRAFLP